MPGKDRAMTIRMSDADYKEIEKKASECGLSVSDYMRLVGKTAKIEVKAGPVK